MVSLLRSACAHLNVDKDAMIRFVQLSAGLGPHWQLKRDLCLACGQLARLAHLKREVDQLRGRRGQVWGEDDIVIDVHSHVVVWPRAQRTPPRAPAQA